ncbi:MAG: sodium:calcium antiporter, partial [Salinibacterium sp.]|nr:sodium:calcium antiporter [Salinibacterium sp.]
MQLLDIVLVLAGLALLIAGGEVLVRGASALAQKLGIPPLVVGLVVVSAATSTPELAVTVGAILRDEPGLAVGNVVGSNIVNILLILGLSAIIVPLAVKRQLVRFDVPVMVGMSVLLLLLSLDGQVGPVDGILLLAGLLVHTFLSVFIGRREAKTAALIADAPLAKIASSNHAANPAPKPIALWLALVLILAGIGLLVLGAQ